ncbi:MULTISPECIES: acyl-CoA thioesterase [Ruegeria]|uniref:acyl-CoA thioesterase n=1 Tax=Ruegeria TaxID=97050 RepID=UPI00147D9AA8|nr:MULTISPECIES: acyl-CoA thioesterase [Ruegeria]UUV08274.1 acyl-CoA thioesterase [Ruegeria sp. YS9]
MLDRSFPEQKAPTKKRQFIWHHCISFEETNVMGNVYFTRHLSWQGKCREMFLKAHAPGTLDELSDDLRLVTLSVNCNYFDELVAFDDIALQMSLAHLNQHRIGLDFAYVRSGDDPRSGERFAQGFQEVGCMRLVAPRRLMPCSPPSELQQALNEFA